MGLDAKPSRPLEFSRAWLGRAAQVRQRRAELRTAGRLDGMDLPALVREGAALSGTLRIPVIPVRYADVPEPFPTGALEERLFGAGRGDTLSFAAYWDEVSGGLLRVEGEVAPWVQLPREANYYLARESHGWARFGRIEEVFREAVRRADGVLDFGAFDNDGPDGVPNSGDDDGHADLVMILVATRCDDWRAGAIWPHRGAMRPQETSAAAAPGGRIRVADYVVLPIVEPGTCGPAHIGVLAHETGHAFGLPDLYDYDGSQGIGAWGLMGTGSHSAPYSPAHLSGWSKEQLGWVRVDWLTSNRSGLEIEPVARSRRIYRYDVPGQRGEYLLLENRQRIGSDSRLPGTGLLVWHVDPEQSELGIWNTDALRRGVRLVEAGDRQPSLARLRGATAADPFPGETGRTEFVLPGRRPLRLANIREDGETIVADVVVGFDAPALVAAPDTLWLEAPVNGGPVTRTVAVAAAGGADARGWTAESGARWLQPRRNGDRLLLRVDPAGLAPGRYREMVRLMLPDRHRPAGGLVVQLRVTDPGAIETVATGVPWSWGLAVHQGELFQASYGWDLLGLRPRPQLLSLRAGRMRTEAIARVPAEALYAPVAAGPGAAYVLARARGENYLYRIERDGTSRVVGAELGTTPAYGTFGLADGSVLIADWDGRIRRVEPDGNVTPWVDLPGNIYQIAMDGTGMLYAAAYDGSVMALDPTGRVYTLPTGFGRGRLVAVAAGLGAGVYAGERGGQGRILRLTATGERELVAQIPGAHFYGLAVEGGSLYALDLYQRRILRFPVARPHVAARGPMPALPASEPREPWEDEEDEAPEDEADEAAPKDGRDDG